LEKEYYPVSTDPSLQLYIPEDGQQWTNNFENGAIKKFGLPPHEENNKTRTMLI
jgi:hypothetical protein